MNLTFLRILRAEASKLKRTNALLVTVLTPLAVVLLNCVMVAVLPGNLARSATPWIGLQRLTFGLWAVLMLPLFITLESTMLAALEHRGNQWKRMFVLPVPRRELYLGKLVIAMGVVYAGTLMVALGVCAGGLLLPNIQPALRFNRPVPWESVFATALWVASLAAWPVALQHWVSLRWRSFSVSVAVGMVASVVGFVLINVGEWGRFYPWAMPSSAVVKEASDLGTILATGWLLAAGSVVLGCWDFCRRELE